MLSELKKQFESAIPDIDVQWFDMGSQEVFDRIKTEKENPLSDIWWGAPYNFLMRGKIRLFGTIYPDMADKVSASGKKSGIWFGTFSHRRLLH